MRGDLGDAVRELKRESGNGLFVGGVKLPQALAELGLIDEYELVVHPRVVGHGPTLFAGLCVGKRAHVTVEYSLSRLVPQRHRPRAELQPAHEPQVELLR